jgi:intracellular multiplication protein IcmL
MSPDKAKKSDKQAPPKQGVPKPKPTAAQLQAYKNSFGTLRTEFFFDQYYALAFVCLCLIIICGAIVVWALFERTLQNEPNQGILSTQELRDAQGNVVVHIGDPLLKFPTTADGKLTYPVPLSEPGISTPGILEWAVEAIEKSYNFNFTNYEDVISNASSFYTKLGYQNYRRNLIETALVNTVERRKSVLTVVPTSAPTILKEKPTPDGVYAWQIQFPMTMSIQNAKEVLKTDWVVTMLILRVPINESPKGVAIAALIVREGRMPA